MCKEGFNSLSGAMEKNSIILGTQMTSTTNSAVTPKSKICPSTQLSEAFYSQAPQTYPGHSSLIQINSADYSKVKNLSHPFMTEFVSQETTNSQPTVQGDEGHFKQNGLGK